jgi:glucan phosphoethanolaminetransferase (alkaline phosphatase superfamily)
MATVLKGAREIPPMQSEKSTGKELLLEFAFVIAFLLLASGITAAIRFAVFSAVSAYGAVIVCPFVLLAIALFLAALWILRPFAKKYVLALFSATIVMLAAYCVANPNCTFWDQVLNEPSILCKSSTTFWLMLILIMLSIGSALILSIDFFRRSYPALLKKIE